jgi:GrpB-like predicted nucleotidyltransferase (UPF0157 family)
MTCGRVNYTQWPEPLKSGLRTYMSAQPESREYKRHIAFRDYLRKHAEDAEDYAVLKRELARKFGSDREGYNQAKSQFVQRILQRMSEAQSHD